MELTKQQFETLSAFAEAEKGIAMDAGHTVAELSAMGLVEDGKITSAGMEALEPYRVKRAIIIAAGVGERLRPVTLDTPKPLVKVKGIRIIDTLIDACLKAGIKDIYIVRGYLAEQFDQLLLKYPMIRFIENPLFSEANNISSALFAKDLMSNSYIFEADLFLSNPDIITKYHYCSDVLGIWKQHTDDWCLYVDSENVVIDEKTCGTNCYQMVGIYYINHDDGQQLAADIEEVFNSPGGKNRFWETVINQSHKGKYRIVVRPCSEEDIVEIDTFEELKAIDSSFEVYKKG